MRCSLILIPYLAILALPGAWGLPEARADSPLLPSSSSVDLLSSTSASSGHHTDFHYRFVTFLADDRLLALFDGDERRQDDDADVKLMLIEEGDEEPNSDTTDELSQDNDGRTQARVTEAIDSATPAEDGEPTEEAWDDGARLAIRLAELNKPATLLTISLPPAQAGDTPINQAAEIFDQAPYLIRGHQGMAPPARRVHVAFFHKPTYYQELNLERCGQLDCDRCGYLQNFYSSVWFIGNTSLLPYRLASQPPCECVMSYGDCTTCHQYDCPIEPLQLGDRCALTSRGLLSQSAALAGFVLLLW